MITNIDKYFKAKKLSSVAGIDILQRWELSAHTAELILSNGDNIVFNTKTRKIISLSKEKAK